VPGALKLSSNELPWAPLPSVAAALERGLGQVARYPDHHATELRGRLAERLGVTSDRVAVGAGAVGLLQQLALAYVDRGDGVVYGDPSFEAYPLFCALMDGVGEAVALRGMTIDGPALAAAVDERTRLVLVSQPNNPTSTAMAAGDLDALAASLPPGCLLVVDEAYREFVTGTHVPDGLDLAARYPHVVVLRTFSKAHGLAALRVGYAVADPRVVDALDQVLLPFAVGSLGQLAALASLDAEDELFDRVGRVVAQRALVSAALAAGGWNVPASETNFLWLPAGRATSELALKLERRGVVARAFPHQGLRVTIGDAPANDEFLRCFFEIAASPLADALAEAWARPAGG
jgi:histidinol-phosphate aminotransferase